MIWTNDPERDFARWDAEQAEKEKELPVCDYCGQCCQHEYYEIHGNIICDDCIGDFKHEVEVF